MLADRVGIIDHGRIVAEGTPDGAEGRDRPADASRSSPPIPADAERARRDPRAASASRAESTRGVAVRLAHRPRPISPASSARSTPRASRSSSSSCTSRRSTTSSSPRPAARSRAPATTRSEARRVAMGSPLSAVSVGTARPGLPARAAARSCARCASRPTSIAPLVFPMMLLAVNSGGLKAETHLPGFPTHSFVAFALAVPFIQGALFATMNSGTDLARDIQTGFLNRLSLTPMRGVALLAGQLGGARPSGSSRRSSTSRSGSSSASASQSGVGGVVVLLVFSALIALAFGALGAFARCAPARARRSRASSRASSSSSSSRR